jgi:FKBP-type peptidyl-prolyl cis-trans isomerase
MRSSLSACLLALLIAPIACKKEAPPAPLAPSPVAADPNVLPAPPDVKAPPADAEKTSSGLASKLLAKGIGTEHPGPTDIVEVQYTGWTTDGKMFDSSVVRKMPAKFPLNGVIKGWTEGVQLMVAGEKRRFWIPANLAYGDPPTRPGAPGGMLVFDIELMNLRHTPPPPPTPPDVAAIPKNAKKTKSGLAYRVLTKGTGKNHPKSDSTVEVHYTGWTTDGKIFDSSVTRGEPATFALASVPLKGWTEGVQMMVPGEKTRFWMPPALAYGQASAHGAPMGMLVFDIELLAIK